MNTSSDTSNNRSGDAVENLLRQAAPRPSPPAGVEHEVADHQIAHRHHTPALTEPVGQPDESDAFLG